VSQARENYAKFKDAAESHNGTVEAVFTSASKGASEYTAKLVEFMKANSSAQLDFAQQLFGAKSPSEALELWTGHARKQLETFQAQAKELVELSQRVAAETAERRRHRQPQHAHLGQLLPARRRSPAVAGPRGAHLRRRARARQKLPHRPLKHALLVGEGEPHGYLRGSPSSRSATTLRWISLVPA
jgi:phasin